MIHSDFHAWNEKEEAAALLCGCLVLKCQLKGSACYFRGGKKTISRFTSKSVLYPALHDVFLHKMRHI